MRWFRRTRRSNPDDGRADIETQHAMLVEIQSKRERGELTDEQTVKALMELGPIRGTSGDHTGSP